MKNRMIYQAFALISLIIVTNTTTKCYGQYGTIELKNGEIIELGDEKMYVFDDSLRYFIEEYEVKVSFYGIGLKKRKKEMLEKSRLVFIPDISKIKVDGKLMVGNDSIIKINEIKYIKNQKGFYQRYYVMKDGFHKLLVKNVPSNVLFVYCFQRGDKTPIEIHEVGVGIGKKFKKRVKKYFEDCPAAYNYISEAKRSKKIEYLNEVLSNVIEIGNESCVPKLHY